MKKDKRKDKKESALKEVKDVKEDRRKNILKSTVMSVIFFLLGAVALLSSFNAGGQVGEAIFFALKLVLGWVAYILFIGFFWVGYNFWTDKEDSTPDFISILALLVILFSLTTFTASLGFTNSGVVGNYLAIFLIDNFGKYLPAILSLALGLIAFVILYQDKPSFSLKDKKRKSEEADATTQAFEKTNSLALDYTHSPVDKRKKTLGDILKPVSKIILKFFKKIFSFLGYILSFKWLKKALAKKKIQKMRFIKFPIFI